MTILAYILALSTVGNVPPHVSASTYLAALRHDQDPVVPIVLFIAAVWWLERHP